MAGVVSCRDPAIAQRLYFSQNAEGTGLAPFDCWLLLRGVKTMPLRLARAQASLHDPALSSFCAGPRPTLRRLTRAQMGPRSLILTSLLIRFGRNL